MPKKAKVNTVLEEAEMSKAEETNRRKKKVLADRAELLRQERELAEAESEEVPEEVSDDLLQVPVLSDQLASIIEGLDDDGKFWVYRMDEKGRSAQVGTYPLADWPDRLEELARELGGGTFRISFRNAKGHPIKQVTQTFDTKAYARKTEGQESSGVVSLMLAQAQEARREAAEARRENSDLMKTILAALMAPKQENGLFKSAQDVAAIGAMFKSNDKSDPMEMFKLGMDMALRMSEGKEPSSTLDRVLETVAGPAAALMARMVPANRPAPPPRAPALGTVPQPILSAPEPVKPAAEVPPADPVKEHPFYKKYVPKILAAAKAGDDPKEWAEYISDLIPAIYHPQLVALMEKPDLVEFLGSYELEARDYAVWIVNVRDAIMGMFPPEEGAEKVPIPGGPGLTPAHVGGDGKLLAPVPQTVLDAMA